MLSERSSPSPSSAGSLPRVIQASFSAGRIPAKFMIRQVVKRAATERPYPGRLAQPQAAPGAASLPPHPATLDRAARLAAARPPHPATLQAKAKSQATVQHGSKTPAPAHPAKGFGARSTPPHPARAPQHANGVQAAGRVHAFQTPAGFLEDSGRSRAQVLPPPVQKKMERFFDADFSDVRIYVGPEATEIGAIAFTLGSDIYFAPGQYEPHTARGQQLLGHELTHVLQQREGRVSNPLGQGVAVVQDTELEDEAERMGHAVAAQRSAVAPPSQGLPSRMPARPPHPAVAGRASPPGPRGAQAKVDYRLVIGTYLHEDADRLPEPLAGHTFIALEQPGQSVQAWGFSPDDFSRYDPHRDLGRLRSGVAGVVHSDTTALTKSGVRTRSYPINEAQARAALAKVAEYQSGRYQFNLDRRQCSTFALDVLRAAEIRDLPSAVRKPHDMYRELG